MPQFRNFLIPENFRDTNRAPHEFFLADKKFFINLGDNPLYVLPQLLRLTNGLCQKIPSTQETSGINERNPLLIFFGTVIVINKKFLAIFGDTFLWFTAAFGPDR